MRLTLSLLFLPVVTWGQNPVVPVLNQLLPDLDLSSGDAEVRTTLADHFGVEEIQDTAVRLTAGWTQLDGTQETRDIDFLLFRNRTPITSANFLGYVNRGDYTNMFVHRLIPGFVIQGGGFNVINGENELVSIGNVTTQDTIQNEFGVSNTLGTISMAKLGDDPNSATSQWFISTGANSDNLDFQNGGFTVFGKVSQGTFGNALELDQQVQFDRYNLGGALGSTPLIRNTTQANLVAESFFRFSSASEIPLPAGQAGTNPTLSYSILSGAGGSGPLVEISGSELVVEIPEATTGGTTSVVVQAEDSIGNVVIDTFDVVWNADYESWRKAVFPEGDVEDDAKAGPLADFNGDGTSNFDHFVYGTLPDVDVSDKLGVPSLILGETNISLVIETGLISGVGFAVEVSTDGENWETTAFTQASTPISSGRSERFTVERSITNHPKSLYRIRYTLN